MAQPNDICTLPRMRTALGIVGDDQDGHIESLRSTAIAVVEKKLRRHILDRTGYESDAGHFIYSAHPTPSIAFRVADIKEGAFTLHYADAVAAPSGKAREITTYSTSGDEVLLTAGLVMIHPSGGVDWASLIRLNHPTPYVTVNVGIDGTEIPSAWGDAVCLIARALLDGSAFDDLAESSMLDYCIGPWLPMPYSPPIRAR